MDKIKGQQQVKELIRIVDENSNNHSHNFRKIDSNKDWRCDSQTYCKSGINDFN